MARIDWTRIFVAAPGLRPTASDAFIPMKPTPRAAPSAANPTCTFPLSSANMGINDIYVVSFLSVARWLPRLNTVKPAKFKSVVRLPRFFIVLTDQHGEHGS